MDRNPGAHLLLYGPRPSVSYEDLPLQARVAGGDDATTGGVELHGTQGPGSLRPADGKADAAVRRPDARQAVIAGHRELRPPRGQNPAVHHPNGCPTRAAWLRRRPAARTRSPSAEGASSSSPRWPEGSMERLISVAARTPPPEHHSLASQTRAIPITTQ